MAVRDFSLSACLSHPRKRLLFQTVHHCYMSHLMTKPTKWHVRPAKTQISLGILPVWLESSLSAWRKLGSLASSCPLNARPRLWSVWAALLLQHMFLGCNCIYKNFVETKNNVLRCLEHLLYSFSCHKN